MMFGEYSSLADCQGDKLLPSCAINQSMHVGESHGRSIGHVCYTS